MLIFTVILISWHLFFLKGAAYLNRAFFGSGAGPIHLDEVVCTGSEDTLLNCSHSGIGINDCNHDADVSVHCQESGTKIIVFLA